VIALPRADELLARFGRQKILVVGDLMIDRYVIGTVSRISPEAPVPVILVTEERAAPGGASNVARNIRSLGGQVIMAGVLGRDAAGAELTRLFGESGIGMEGVVADAALTTTVKTRIVAERQQVARVDHEGSHELPAAVRDELGRRLRALAGEVTGVILEDYNKGVLGQDIVDLVMEVCVRRGIPVALDPKDDHPLRTQGLALATPNYREALNAAGLGKPRPGQAPGADGRLQQAGEILSRAWGTDMLLITLGQYGMYLRSRDGVGRTLPTRAREVFDVQGAGDTVIGTALLALVSGANHEEAAVLANAAAGVVVGKFGTATCSPDELRGVL
jgi:D-glycero-beta-D-manno-heptose-7-phosphate kinase